MIASVHAAGRRSASVPAREHGDSVACSLSEEGVAFSPSRIEGFGLERELTADAK